MKAFLILENGTIFTGKSIGIIKETISELVFNTSMTGYLEVLTDPSYAGQAVVMTYPLIGNYGICYEDMESEKAWLDGFIVRELARKASNFRNETDLEDFLIKNNIPGIEGIDTRALTKILREKGTMNAMITTKEDYNLDEILPKIKAYHSVKPVQKVTCKEEHIYQPKDLHTKKLPAEKLVALLDFGSKYTITKSLLNRGCKVIVYPAYTKAEKIIEKKPDGIVLSNGPGDPKECTEIIEEIKKLYACDIPIFAICLGHQLMALANGANTHKMKYGHRGANHPVKDVKTGRIYLSSQNHGYVVEDNTIDKEIAEVSFYNVNDKTIEGLHYLGKNIFTVQFHPEACAGPKDSELLFDEFIHMMEVCKNA